MKLWQIVLLCLALWLSLCAVPGEARRLPREASAAPEPIHNAELTADESKQSEEFISDATTTAKPLGIVSIKSRAIAMDRALCKEQSRYHPHFPKCHQYCKRLDHWIGQCWRESCHCIS